MNKGAAGRSLVELLAVITIGTWLAALGYPALADALARARLRAAMRHLSSQFHLLRTSAALHGRSLGLIFDPADGYAYSIYRDGNGNGIRRIEVRRGIDPRLLGPVRFIDQYTGVQVAILAPPPVPEIPPRTRPLERLYDPVKFGRSDIISCSRQGSCSSGTVYLSSGRHHLGAVRMRGWDRRVLLYTYDARGKLWQPR